MIKQLPIVELFSAAQGEGKYVGTPSIFIRTNGCNLRCQWGEGNKCDTWYTSWSPEKSKNMTIDGILKEVKKLARGVVKHVVLTGGESLMHVAAPYLVEDLIGQGYMVTIETNGTYPLHLPKFPIQCTYNNLFLSISPKLRTSTPFGTKYAKEHSLKRINMHALRQLTNNYRGALKFVVSSKEDLAEIHELQDKLNVPSSYIYLMPEGITVEEIQKSSANLIKICIANGYNFSDRLHIRVFGNKRGV